MHAVSALLSLAAYLLVTTPIANALPSPPPPNLGTLVNLRIEGADRTIFEDVIFTRGRNVTTASGFTLECNGLNDNANPKPGPTATGALDDASLRDGFTWDGTFFSEFDDISVTRIAGSEQTDTQFWGLLLDFAFAPVGGCQQEVAFGDHVLWAFDAFNAEHFLSLAGPDTATPGRPVTFTVTDGATGDAIANATVVSSGTHTAVTDAQGKAKLIFASKGAHSVKASKPDSIRSNAVKVLVV